MYTNYPHQEVQNTTAATYPQSRSQHVCFQMPGAMVWVSIQLPYVCSKMNKNENTGYTRVGEERRLQIAV